MSAKVTVAGGAAAIRASFIGTSYTHSAPESDERQEQGLRTAPAAPILHHWSRTVVVRKSTAGAAWPG
jgi:hypothetical protein